MLNDKRFYREKTKCFFLIYFLNRFFNDIELKSTQKQAITIHTLTVNRTDQTDAGRFFLIGVYKAVADNGTRTPVETTCTLTVGIMYLLFLYIRCHYKIIECWDKELKL